MSNAHDDKWVVEGLDCKCASISYSYYSIGDAIERVREMVKDGFKDVIILGPNDIKHPATEDPLKTILGRDAVWANGTRQSCGSLIIE